MSDPRARGSRVLVVALVVAACSEPDVRRASPPPPRANEVASLGAEVGARVGAELIPLTVVQQVADAQGVDAREAVERVVDDEVVASAARARGLEGQPPAAWLLRAARARLVVTRIFEDAKRRGPPTDDEVNALSEKHWLEVDRPPAVRTEHALVLWPKDAKDTALKAEARRLASAIHAAVVGVSDEQFEARAQAARSESSADSRLELKVERLPGLAADGRVVEGGGAMDPVFSAAATALSKPGDTSAVVETRFGAHVIRLLERLPEQRMPFEQRRLAFAEEVYSLRAHDLLVSRLAALRSDRGVGVGISSVAEPLMRSVSVMAAAEVVAAPP